MLLGAESTTTTVVPRVVGDPLPYWVWVGAGALLLAAILIAGFIVQRRQTG